jgi:ferrous iron transport protein B
MGTLTHHDHKIAIIDLPGIYSLSTYSMEELVTRDYIALEKPDVVINVLDATALERNLFFTLQLLEMEAPVVVALNQMDAAQKKGISIDTKKLQKLLGCPVMPTVAIKAKGLHELIDRCVEYVEHQPKRKLKQIEYGQEIEERISELVKDLDKIDHPYTSRWLAIKLLEKDDTIIKLIKGANPSIIKKANKLADELAEIHGEISSVVISGERYTIASKFADEIQTFQKSPRVPLNERMDSFVMHGIWGYLLMFVVLLGILVFISIVGDELSGLIEGLFESFRFGNGGFWEDLLWNGAVVGFYAALSVAIGFILPFYLLLGVIEDSGYIPRIAF